LPSVSWPFHIIAMWATFGKVPSTCKTLFTLVNLT
jgi:hypothetical protein